MDPVYVHLLLNHAPVIGLAGALLLLAASLKMRSRDLANAGLVALVLVAITTIPVYLTGEPSEERVEHLPGVEHDNIEEHEDSAMFALIAAELAGVVALVALFMTRGNASRKWIVITLVIAVWAFAVLARTAQLGGKIRHTEIGATTTEADRGRSGND